MPYVTPERRLALKPPGYMSTPPAVMEVPGDLAYLLADACATYLRQRGTSWQTISDVLGSLDGVARDFWTRVGQPYEDLKRDLNGPIPYYEAP